MRVPVGLLIISGMVVCMYLLGLLVTYKHRQISFAQESNEAESKPTQYEPTDDQDADDDQAVSIVGTLSSPSIDIILRQKIDCDNKELRSRTYQRGSFWVLENFVVAERNDVKCYESITYTTHTDHTFLDNLVPVVQRWRAPVSVALYAPADDFRNAVDAIFWMRNCLDNQRDMELIKELVSFHVYFNSTFMPTGSIRYPDESAKHISQCSENPMLRPTFKEAHKLFYPVNVGRNVARDAAATYFIFPSDIELYPSPGIVPRFLQMIANEPKAKVPLRRVFPIAIYEVAENVQVPSNKTELVAMLHQKTAQRFHAHICANCHSVPENDKWEATPEGNEMKIFAEVKRTGKFHHWEPIYIGTQLDPYYDERLSWEGKSDKMTQGYLLCVLDYTMSLLSDAFLVHRPGFKKYSDAVRPKLEQETFALIQKVIGPELMTIYGKRRGCNL